MILLLKSYPYHFVRTILYVPFCPIPFCPSTILSIPFCPYHFVRYHFVRSPSVVVYLRLVRSPTTYRTCSTGCQFSSASIGGHPFMTSTKNLVFDPPPPCPHAATWARPHLPPLWTSTRSRHEIHTALLK